MITSSFAEEEVKPVGGESRYHTQPAGVFAVLQAFLD